MRYDSAQNNEQRKLRVPPEEIARLYLAGSTIQEIAKHYGVSVAPINRLLKESHIPMRQAAPRAGLFGGPRNPAWKGGRRIRKDGYALVSTLDGVRLEHRIVMEALLGRPLSRLEVVHHKDGNPSNNTPDNLELVASQSVHAKLHGAQERSRLLAHGEKRCTLCNCIKPITAFHKTKSNAMGIQSWCKQCKNTRDKNRKRIRYSSQATM